MLQIVLYQPEIPPNTGNIGRLCVSNDLKLHLIKPFGFQIDDKHLRRSGLDYWEHLNYQIHESWQNFLLSVGPEINMWFFTTKSNKNFWSVSFKENDFLVFGPETRGLPNEILQIQPENNLVIPMTGSNKRSLNLSTSVGIATYEALRQLTYKA